MGGFVSNLDKLRKAGCDMFIAASGSAMMGVSEGELENGTAIPDEAWIAGIVESDEGDPNRYASSAKIVWIGGSKALRATNWARARRTIC
jgi:hypothetical protein